MSGDLDVIVSSARKIIEIYELADCEIVWDLRADSEALALQSNDVPGTKTASILRQHGQQLIALHQNLTGLFGHDDAAAIRWLQSHNVDLASRPIEMLCSIEEIGQVNAYLVSYRFKS